MPSYCDEALHSYFLVLYAYPENFFEGLAKQALQKFTSD